MKKITILLASAGLLLGLPSCDEWLTATSSTQISDTQLFSSRNGFQEALSGIYLCMAQPECYGRDYTWFVSDLTAFPYAAQHSNNYISLQNHNYTNAISFPVFTSMWQSGYHAIANINKMLQELDARRDVVSDETEYRLFRGELLGLRAWIHFDILRTYIHVRVLVYLRHHLKAREACMTASRGIKRRHAHKSVHAVLRL